MTQYVVRLIEIESEEQIECFEENTPAAAMKRERILNEKIDREVYYTQMDEVVE